MLHICPLPAQHQPSVYTTWRLFTRPSPKAMICLTFYWISMHLQVLQLAVLSFCFGFGVVYLVIIRDILLGTPPDCNGLLCEVLGLSPSSVFYDARVVILLVAVLVCCPLLLLRWVLLPGLPLGLVQALLATARELSCITLVPAAIRKSSYVRQQRPRDCAPKLGLGTATLGFLHSLRHTRPTSGGGCQQC